MAKKYLHPESISVVAAAIVPASRLNSKSSSSVR
jgi:hypothetical protein